jgi:hypothetical protein
VLGIPSLPTDNLYKFRALAGLSVVLASLAALLSIAAFESRRFTGWAELLAANSVLEYRSKALDEIERIAKFDTSGAVNRFVDRDRDSVLQMRRRLTERVYMNREMRGLVWYFPEIVFMLVLIGVTYPAAMYTNQAFESWQHRHQDHQDRLLRAEVRMAELNVERAEADFRSTNRTAAPPSEAA